MFGRTESILPKREWWKEVRPNEEYATLLESQRDAFRALSKRELASLPWSHCVVVESNDARLPNYFCGQACCVEVATISFLGRQRLAAWWTGERIGEYMQYGSVPSTFLLVPYLEVLGKSVLDIIAGCGCKRVPRKRRRPGKNEFWLEMDTEEQQIIVQFHTARSARRFQRELIGAGIFFNSTDPTYDIIAHPLYNIIR